jgi:hypothetical protein
MSSRRRSFRTIALLGSLVMGLASAGQAEEKPPGSATPLVVRYHDDKLTVRAKDAATADVLQELARSTGASIQGAQPTIPRINADFENVPLVEGLGRLFGKDSFNLTYGRHGLREIRLLGSGPAVSVPAAPAQPEPLPPAVAQLAGSVMLPLRNHSPVPISGVLAHALGASSATFDQLVQAALHDKSSEVRDAAAKACIQTVEGDTSVLQAFQNAVGGMDDQSLAGAAQRLGGPNVEQFVRSIAANAHEPDLRARAATVLERLHAQPGVAPTSGS